MAVHLLPPVLVFHVATHLHRVSVGDAVHGAILPHGLHDLGGSSPANEKNIETQFFWDLL